MNVLHFKSITNHWELKTVPSRGNYVSPSISKDILQLFDITVNHFFFYYWCGGVVR